MMKKIIKIRELFYTYPDKKNALNGVDLEVYEGESLGIIGPNGAGKSTLLMHLNGVLTGKGSIVVCGLEVKEDNLANIRSKVGLVFQEPDHQLFMPNVFDDVAFGPMNMLLDKKDIELRVKEALLEVDMFEFADRPSHHLSIGEKKRVSIATVLSMKPQILALDEPSSNLDPKHRRDLIRILNKSSLTKIIASHDLELILDTCSRVVLLDKGRIIASGEPSRVLSDKFLLESHSLEVPYSLQAGVRVNKY